MSRLARAVTEVAYSTQDIWASAPYVAVSAAICIGGFIALLLVLRFIGWVPLWRESVVEYVRVSRTRYRRLEPRARSANALRIFTILFFFAGMCYITWFAAASVGYNPWIGPMATMAVGLFATYVFGGPLSQLGSAFVIFWLNTIAVGEYYSFHGMAAGWEGVILAIGFFEVLMGRWDEEKLKSETFTVPISTFSQPKMRSEDKEEALRAAQVFLTGEEWEYLQYKAPGSAPPAGAQTRKQGSPSSMPPEAAPAASRIGARVPVQARAPTGSKTTRTYAIQNHKI